MHAKRWLPFAAFLLIAALLATGVWLSRRDNREALPSPLIGKPAPEFALPVLHEPGRIVTSKELRGQPYLLNVWGSWCVECQVEHPVVTRFAETKRLRVIGYNWKDEPADALAWLERLNNPYWLVLADVEGRTAIDFGIYGAPETFLIDARGMVRWKHVGAMTDAIVRDELLPALAKLPSADDERCSRLDSPRWSLLEPAAIAWTNRVFEARTVNRMRLMSDSRTHKGLRCPR